jgi:hypothetical protein
MRHKDLVAIGREWLARRCPVVVTELSSQAGETPDVIGFQGRVSGIGYGTHLIECKASRSDFLSDSKKHYRRCSGAGMGNYRYYMAPKGLLKAEDMPENWGLIEVSTAGRVSVLVCPILQETNQSREVLLLVSVMRRLHLPDGNHSSLKVKSYTIQNKNTATMTINEAAPPSGKGE